MLESSSQNSATRWVASTAMKRWAKGILSLLLMGSLGYYIASHWGRLAAVFDASAAQLLGLGTCILLTWVVASVQSLVLLRRLNARIGFVENLLLTVASVLGNYAPMRFGSLLRMRYLKRFHALGYVTFTGLAGARLLIILTASCGVVALGLATASAAAPGLSWLFAGLVGAAAVAMASIFLLPRADCERRTGVVWRALQEFLVAFRLFRGEPTLLGQVAGLVVVSFVLLAVRLGLSLAAFQIDLEPLTLLMLASTSTLVSFLSVTPGNLGFREWTIGTLGLALGLDFTSAVFAATLDRAVLLVCTFVLGPGPLAYIWIRTVR